jgi:hypothetical protein
MFAPPENCGPSSLATIGNLAALNYTAPFINTLL